MLGLQAWIYTKFIWLWVLNLAGASWILDRHVPGPTALKLQVYFCMPPGNTWTYTAPGTHENRDKLSPRRPRLTLLWGHPAVAWHGDHVHSLHWVCCSLHTINGNYWVPFPLGEQVDHGSLQLPPMGNGRGDAWIQILIFLEASRRHLEGSFNGHNSQTSST